MGYNTFIFISIFQIEEISDTLANAISLRLLIPGVITMTILNQFINCLKVMQILDPKGITFSKLI